MTKFLTGKTRTLTASFTFSGKYTWYYDNRSFPSPVPFPVASAHLTGSAFGLTLGIEPYVVIPDPEPLPGAGSVTIGYGFRLTAGDGELLFTTDSTFAAGTVGVADRPFSGTGTITAPVSEYIELTGSGLGAGIWFADIPDAPPYTKATLGEVLTGDAAATITINSHTATGGGSTYGAVISQVLFPQITDANAYDSADATYEVGASTTDFDLATTGSSATASDSLASATATSGDGASVALTTDAGGQAIGVATAQMWGKRQYSISAVIRAMDLPYPGSLTVLTSVGSFGVSGGSGSLSTVTQQRYSSAGNVQVGGSGGPSDSYLVDADEFVPVTASIATAGLTTNGDDTRLYRIPFRGKEFGGIGLSQAATFPLPSLLSGWTATGAATVTDNPTGGRSGTGSITIDTTSGAGGITKSLSPLQNWQSYAFLKVGLKSIGSASVAGTLIVPPTDPTVFDATEYPGSVDHDDVYTGAETPSKEFGVTSAADGVWVDRAVDLCSPSNATAATDDWDTRFPLPTREGWYTGVGRVDTLSFTFPAGKVIEIDLLSLFRTAAPTVTWLPTFYRSKLFPATETTPEHMEEDWPIQSRPQETLDTGTVLNYYKRPFLIGNTEGRQSLEEPDLEYTRTAPSDGDPSWAFDVQSIAGLVAQINATDPHSAGGIVRYPGWAATSATPVPSSGCGVTFPPANDCLFNESNPAVYLYGGGCYAKADGTWEFPFDVAPGAPAQPLYDEVEGYAGCGDSFGYGGGSGAYGLPLILRAGQILRSQAHGITLDDTGARASGTTVTMTQDAGTVGTDASDSSGYYATSGNSAKGNRTAQAEQGTNAVVFSGGGSVIKKVYSRHRHRASFRIGEVVFYGPLAIDSPRGWLHVASKKKIVTYYLASASMAFTSADHAVDEWLHLCVDTRQSRLFLLGQDGTSAKVFVSGDGGQTITEVLSVTANTSAIERDSERRWLLFLFENSGAIQRQISRDGGANWEAAANIKDASAADITAEVVDLAQDARQAGTLLMTTRHDPGGGGAIVTKVWRSDDAGETWRVLLA